MSKKEGESFWAWFLGRVRIFIKKAKLWDNERVVISDVKTNKIIEATVAEVNSDAAFMWTNPRTKAKKRRSADTRDLYQIRGKKR